MSVRPWGDDLEMPVPLSQRTHFMQDSSVLVNTLSASNERRGKVFNDPVHGHIYLSGTACDIIGALPPKPPPWLCALPPLSPAATTPRHRHAPVPAPA